MYSYLEYLRAQDAPGRHNFNPAEPFAKNKRNATTEIEKQRSLCTINKKCVHLPLPQPCCRTCYY